MRKVLLILTLLFCSTLWGCVQDRYDATPSPTPENGDMTFTLNVRVPGSSTIPSRSLTPGQETQITSLDVLVFEKPNPEKNEAPGTSVNETFRYHASAKASDIQSITTDGVVSGYNIRVPLKATTEKMTDRLVLIANASEEVATVVKSWSESTTYEEAIPQLTFATDAKWTTTENDWRPLPMWGELSNQTISEVNQELQNPITLLRAVARVDVGCNLPAKPDEDFVNGATNGLENFEIQAVEITNVPSTSRLIPDPDNYLDSKVSEPTLVAGAEVENLTYTAPNVSGFFRDIYIGEAAAGSCKMLLQAKFNEVSYWYRLDFIDADKQPLAILRNYRYSVNITDVTGPGYINRNEALNAPASNLLKYEVIEMDENDSYLKDIVYADGFYLAVDRSEVELYTRGDQGHEIIVSTNYTGGFTIEKGEGNDWFQVTPESVSTAGEEKITVEYNGDATGVSTPGSFTIRAGKITKEITVNLLDETLLTLSFSADQLNFKKTTGDGDIQNLTVTYSPEDAVLTWEEDSEQSDIIWKTSPVKEDVNENKDTGTGQVIIPMLPEPSTDVLRSSQIVFTLTENVADGETPKTITKKLTVIQYDGEVFFLILNTNMTVDAGAVSHTFKIKSSYNWRLEGAAPVENEDSEVQDIQLKDWDKETQVASQVYKNFKVTFAPNYTWEERRWHFIPTSDEPYWVNGLGDWWITQAGTKPTMEVTADKQDFGVGAESESIEVTVKTDAQWGFESQDGKAAWTNIAGVDEDYPYGYPGGAESENPDGHGTDNCGFPQEYQLSFPGRAYNPTGMEPIPAVGTTTVPVTFKTYTGGLAAKETEQTLEFTRTVPGFFRSVVDGDPGKLQVNKTSLPHEGGEVEVSFATNMGWEVTTSNNRLTENSSGKAANYGNITQIVNITTPLWNENFNNDGLTTGTVTITARPDGEPAVGEQTELTAQVQQEMYYMTYAGWADKKIATDSIVDLNFVAPITPTIRLEGVFPALDIVVRSVGKTEQIVGTIPASATNGPIWEGTVTLTAPDPKEVPWGPTIYDVYLKTHDEPRQTLNYRIGKVSIPGYGIPKLGGFRTDEYKSWWGNVLVVEFTRPSTDVPWPEELIIKPAPNGYNHWRVFPSDEDPLLAAVFVNVPGFSASEKFQAIWTNPDTNEKVNINTWTTLPAFSEEFPIPSSWTDPVSEITYKILRCQGHHRNSLNSNTIAISVKCNVDGGLRASIAPESSGGHTADELCKMLKDSVYKATNEKFTKVWTDRYRGKYVNATASPNHDTSVTSGELEIRMLAGLKTSPAYFPGIVGSYSFYKDKLYKITASWNMWNGTYDMVATEVTTPDYYPNSYVLCDIWRTNELIYQIR